MRVRVLLAVVLAFGLAGCSPDPSVTVTGTVTYESKPIEEGSIIFEAVGDGPGPAEGVIKDGKYSVRVIPGPKKVRINASRPGPVDPVMKTPYPISYIPTRYNAETKLTADVKPGHKEPIDYALTEK